MSFMTVLRRCVLYLIMLEMGNSEEKPLWTAVEFKTESLHLCLWRTLFCSLPPSHLETAVNAQRCLFLSQDEEGGRTGSVPHFTDTHGDSKCVRPCARHWCQGKHWGGPCERLLRTTAPASCRVSFCGGSQELLTKHSNFSGQIKSFFPQKIMLSIYIPNDIL